MPVRNKNHENVEATARQPDTSALMTSEQIKQHLTLKPFRPFWLETTGGSRIRVARPQWVWMPENGNGSFAVFSEGHYYILAYRDLLDNVVIEVPPPEA
jgi:hypothetical protein